MTASSSRHLAPNPYLPSYEYIPDAEPRVFGDRVYVYGSHDKFGGDTYCMLDYVCYSAPVDDLGDWRYEGVIYRRDQDPMSEGGTRYMYAPDCVQGPDGRYYLYYCENGAQTTSVAVCDEPAGKFEFYGHVRYPDGRLWGVNDGDAAAFDPGVLVDDDGSVYLFTGFAPNEALLHITAGSNMDHSASFGVKLEADMLTMAGEPQIAAPGPLIAEGTGYEGHEFFEASSPRKINGRYYLVYSSMNFHELCYGTADTPLGPYKYGGTIVSIADLGYEGNTEPLNHVGNTHGGLVEIKGQWYVFYHRHTNHNPFSRQAMAEPIEILPDGSIPQVRSTTSGLTGPLPGIGCYEARIGCNLGCAGGLSDNVEQARDDQPYYTQSGEDRESNGDQYVANLRDGSWVGFRDFVLGEATEIAVAVRGAAGEVHVLTDLAGEPVAVVQVNASEGWDRYFAPFASASGTLPLFFKFVTDGVMDFAGFELR